MSSGRAAKFFLTIQPSDVVAPTHKYKFDFLYSTLICGQQHQHFSQTFRISSHFISSPEPGSYYSCRKLTENEKPTQVVYVGKCQRKSFKCRSSFICIVSICISGHKICSNFGSKIKWFNLKSR